MSPLWWKQVLKIPARCASQARWSGSISPNSLGFVLQAKCLTLRFPCCTSFLWFCNKWPEIQHLRTTLVYCLTVSVGQKTGVTGSKSRFWLLCSQLEFRVVLQAYSYYWQNSVPCSCWLRSLFIQCRLSAGGLPSATSGHLHSLACGPSIFKLAIAP